MCKLLTVALTCCWNQFFDFDVRYGQIVRVIIFYTWI